MIYISSKNTSMLLGGGGKSSKSSPSLAHLPKGKHFLFHVYPLFWQIKKTLGQKTLGHTTRKPKGGPLDKKNIFSKKFFKFDEIWLKKSDIFHWSK